MTSRDVGLNGILIIDKPAGWTSHDVVAKLRGVTRQKRVGHGGTLDPMATGVLPVFIGRATRAAEFCENAGKEYIAGLRFGIITDTQDITGNIQNTHEAPGSHVVSVTHSELSKVLPSFLGRQKQIPPMFSAIKQNGKKLYELARRGEVVERPARDIEIMAIEIVEKLPEADAYSAVIAESTATKQSPSQDIYIRVACSKGTYIRTLCHDIGAALGCGAALSYLRRTRAGAFTIDMARTLEEVIGANPDRLRGMILPVDKMFTQYPSICLGEEQTRKAKNGAICKMPGTADGKYKVYSPDGEFLLLGQVCGGRLKTIKSFFEV